MHMAHIMHMYYGMATPNPVQDAGLIVVADANLAGAIFWWTLSGNISVERLHSAWVAAGFDENLLPSPPTPYEALNRAMHAFQTKRVLARPLGGRKGWALVEESPTSEGGLEYTTQAIARLIEGELVVEDLGILPPDQIQDRYEYFRHTLTPTDVSMWLSTKLVGLVHAAKLRPTGGVYFVPYNHVAVFKSWAKLLREVSDHMVYEVPALKSDEAVEAVLAALIAEADKEISAMETELDMEDLGPKALRTRGARCDSLCNKLEAYKGLLGRGLENTQTRLEHLQATIVTAAFVEEIANDEVLGS